MKVLNKVVEDFKLLSSRDKFQLLLLISVVVFGLNIYHKIYLDQAAPCKVINAFIGIPLPSEKYVHIIPNNYEKLSVFSITCIVDDTNNQYEKTLTKYLIDNTYRTYGDKRNNEYTVFGRDGLDFTIKKNTNYLIFSLDKTIKGVFAHE